MRSESPAFLSVDWGTSRLRIRQVLLPGMELAGSYHSEMGVRVVHQEIIDGRASSEKIGQPSAFRHFLDTLEMACQEAMFPFPVQGLPVLLSGMASSSLGMCELPYASLPFSAQGLDLLCTSWPARGSLGRLTLISGVGDGLEVMRGEESLLVGMYRKYQPRGRSLFLFPGTHSKHLTLEDDRVTRIQTFMTGECFDLLSRYSVLSASVEKGDFDEPGLAIFRQGVLVAQGSGHLLNTLFSVRTKDLFGNYSRRQNYFFLSGLLIGTELGTLAGRRDIGPVYLCASTLLCTLYAAAADVLNIAAPGRFFVEKDEGMMLALGQWHIMKNHSHA